jgi:hypothetical protein
VENKEKEKEKDALAGRKVEIWLVWADRRVAAINFGLETKTNIESGNPD